MRRIFCSVGGDRSLLVSSLVTMTALSSVCWETTRLLIVLVCTGESDTISTTHHHQLHQQQLIIRFWTAHIKLTTLSSIQKIDTWTKSTAYILWIEPLRFASFSHLAGLTLKSVLVVTFKRRTSDRVPIAWLLVLTQKYENRTGNN